MTQRGNGGIIGVQNIPALSAASGVWAVNEVQRAAIGATWPLSVVPDPNFRNVTLLLNGEGTNGAQNNTFIDSSPNALVITRNGNTTQGAFSPYGNRWSNLFNAASSLSYTQPGSTFPAQLSFLNGATGTGTVECWVFVQGSSQGANNYDFPPVLAVGDTYVSFGVTTSNTVRFYWWTGVPNSIDSTLTVPFNTWAHIAFVRNGTTVTLYVNGVAGGSTTYNGWSWASASNGSVLNIGYSGAGGSQRFFNGYISNLRVVNGTAVYTSNFTPPTAPLTAIANTSLLTCHSNRFLDASINNVTFTTTGSPSVQRFSPFSPNAPYAAATIGGSGYFDGTGDHLTLPAGSAFAFGTGDFTVECWYYPTSAPTYGYIVDARNSGQTNTWAFAYGLTGVNPGDSGKLGWFDGSTILQESTPSTRINTWNHLCYVRSGTTGSLFVNGVRVATATNSTNINVSPTVSYICQRYSSAADQIIFGYISSLRVVKGTAVYDPAQTTLTVPTAPVTAITNTSLLLNFTNGGVIDTSTLNVFETFGGAQISTSIRRYGGGSIAFNGTNSYLSLLSQPHLNLATGDFTIELWFYTTTATTAQQIFIRRAAVAARGLQLNISGVTSQRITFFAGDTSTTGWEVTLTGATSLVNNTWYHIAVTRSGNTFTLWVNGVSDATASSGVTIADDASPLLIGVNDAAGAYVNGFIDDFRITRGVARYTSAFTPPIAQLSGL